MRLFDQHKIREIQSLNGVWRYMPDPEDKGENLGWFKGFPDGEIAFIPSVWNSETGLLGFEGAVWYEKRFDFNAGTLRICFEAVTGEADVWLDGEKLGSHYGGFSEFDFIKPDVSSGEHILVVRVDNRFNKHSIPQKRVDWYNFGGIVRDVWAERLDGICVLSNMVSYILSEDNKTAQCVGDIVVYNADKTAKTDNLSLKIGEASTSLEVNVAPGEKINIKTGAIILDNVNLWDTKTPNLYRVTASTKTDDLIDRIGIRRVEVFPDGIYLNGEKVYIKGVNRHEYYPGFGFAFPLSLMKRDIDIITEMGCNAIRGSHYPNSKQFLDLLDEKGVLFWSEIPIWGCGFSPETLGDPIILERGLNMHREMVTEYYNHPSIIIWGMHNEIRSDTPEGYKMSECYYKFLKENGGARLVTFASNQSLNDICFEFCDFISVNRYIGWYEDHLTWEEFLKELGKYRDSLGLSHKPIVIGEFGAAAIYGNHTFDNIPWTEEYQAELIENCINLYKGDKNICGMFIWQFCDIRTTPIGLDRSRGFNNKGLVNEYRKPKAAYYSAKRAYKED